MVQRRQRCGKSGNQIPLGKDKDVGRANICPGDASCCALVSTFGTEEVQLAAIPRGLAGDPKLEIDVGHFADTFELRHSRLLEFPSVMGAMIQRLLIRPVK